LLETRGTSGVTPMNRKMAAVLAVTHSGAGAVTADGYPDIVAARSNAYSILCAAARDR
jgi:hypothetical protein